MPVDGAAQRFRDRLVDGRLMTVPGAFNALSAVMIERAGFETLYVTGAGVSNAYLGVPDLGLMTHDELVANVRHIRRATTIPLIVDIDTGFGGVHNVARVVGELSELGVAAVQIEDQVTPKRCGHFDGKRVVPPVEMVAKLTAAIDARGNGDLMIIARTDGIAVEGIDVALERAKLYVEAGADISFVEAMETVEQIEQVAREVPGPKIINMVEGGRTPLLDPARLEELGYAVALHANFALRAMIKVLPAQLSRLFEEQSSRDFIDEIATWEERQDLVSLDGYVAREEDWFERSARMIDSAGSREDPDDS